MEAVQQNRLSNIGTIIGLIALGIAIFHFFLGPIEKSPTLEEYVAEKTISIKSAISSKLKGEEVVTRQERSIGTDEIVGYVVIILGFAAICFGVIGFLKKEEWKVSSVAVTIGASALIFKFAIAVAGAILLIVLIGTLLGGFGL
ncbi:hypothetical protein PGH07_00800 [Sulfurovum sp. zt1-1]|uniref:Inner membrane protein yidI n=1 Tax=Sulfurovum zhangzhouensis TaxID=3019067 RepID=A0ABT7QV94_9BACT|nr:hypothetical protein [Sulfurovum zhangzhouensis]MDM5270712.1 hypothetical protein [Sulfurovum zhangzhouensis]